MAVGDSMANESCVTAAFGDRGSLDGILHFFSMRCGGVSRPPYDTLNLSFQVGDDPTAVRINRQRVCQALGIPLSAWTSGQQCHGAHVAAVQASDRGRGSEPGIAPLAQTDALVTNHPGICLVVLVADCVPLLIADPRRRAIAAVHAGWRGTVDQIARRTVQTLRKHYGCQPDELRAAIGPAIAGVDYPVGSDVVQTVQRQLAPWADEILLADDRGQVCLDLPRANVLQLVAAGVQPDNIEVWSVSTYRSTDRFYSARAANGPTGRFAAGLMLFE